MACRAGQSRRDVLPLRDVQPLARRRRDVQRRPRAVAARRGRGAIAPRPRRRQAAQCRCAIDSPGRRQPRHVDRSDERRTAWRSANDAGVSDLDDARPHVAARAAPDRADLSRDGGQRAFRITSTATSRTARRIAGRATAAPANTIARSEWHGVEGGESGWATPDPVDRISSGRPRPARARAAASSFASTSARDRVRTSKSGRSAPADTPAAEVKYRFVWDAPFTISPHDHNTHLHRQPVRAHDDATADERWQVISPDLTRNDKSQAADLRRPHAGQHRRRVRRRHLRDRRVARADRRDLGRARTTVSCRSRATAARRGRTSPRTSRAFRSGAPCVTSSRRGTPRARRTSSSTRHQENNRDPWVYKTDGLRQDVEAHRRPGFPKSTLSYAHIIREDPVQARPALPRHRERAVRLVRRRRALAAAHAAGLPHAPVYGLVIQEHFNDLVDRARTGAASTSSTTCRRCRS